MNFDNCIIPINKNAFMLFVGSLADIMFSVLTVQILEFCFAAVNLNTSLSVTFAAAAYLNNCCETCRRILFYLPNLYHNHIEFHSLQ